MYPDLLFLDCGVVSFSLTTELGLIEGRFRLDELYKLIDLSLVAVLLLLLVTDAFALAAGVAAAEFEVLSADAAFEEGVSLLLAFSK
jgi:hypothetical protein